MMKRLVLPLGTLALVVACGGKAEEDAVPSVSPTNVCDQIEHGWDCWHQEGCAPGCSTDAPCYLRCPHEACPDGFYCGSAVVELHGAEDVLCNEVAVCLKEEM